MTGRITFLPAAVARDLDTPVNLIGIYNSGQVLMLYRVAPSSFLHLEFDDVDEGGANGGRTKPFEIGQAREILAFVDGCAMEDIVVHCQAGMSRSCAVAKFCADHMGYFLDLRAPGCRGTDIHYNRLVYRTLQDAKGGSMREYYAQLEADGV
ncbi:hypothetical protein ACYPKM_02480 [Pseudomonas aeruginosa]